ncbi:hypothetical protein [Nitrosopumilus sp. K4]|nr:hypothetical protein [Nitrosopumilus sp. K4]
MKEYTSLSSLKNSIKSSFDKISSISEELPNKWRIGRRNFP